MLGKILPQSSSYKRCMQRLPKNKTSSNKWNTLQRAAHKRPRISTNGEDTHRPKKRFECV